MTDLERNALDHRVARTALIAALAVFLGALAMFAGVLAQVAGLSLFGVLALIIGLASCGDWLRLRRQLTAAS